MEEKYWLVVRSSVIYLEKRFAVLLVRFRIVRFPSFYAGGYGNRGMDPPVTGYG